MDCSYRFVVLVTARLLLVVNGGGGVQEERVEDTGRRKGKKDELRNESTNRSEVEGEKEANTLSKVDYGGGGTGRPGFRMQQYPRLIYTSK